MFTESPGFKVPAVVACALTLEGKTNNMSNTESREVNVFIEFNG